MIKNCLIIIMIACNVCENLVTASRKFTVTILKFHTIYNNFIQYDEKGDLSNKINRP